MLQAFVDQLIPALRMLDESVDQKAVEYANLRVIQAFYQAVAKGDFTSVKEHLAEEITFELQGGAPLPYQMQAKGIDEVMDGLTQNFAATEWTAINIETLVAQGDQVILIVDEEGRYRQTKESFHRRSMLEYRLHREKLVRFRGWTFGSAGDRPAEAQATI